MAEVDPYDDLVFRYVIRRHQYDLQTKHFRWFYESAYDSKWEYKRRLQEAFDELAVCLTKGEAHIKEQVGGQKLEVGYFSNSKSRRERQFLQGSYRPANWTTRIFFMFFPITHRLRGRIHKH